MLFILSQSVIENSAREKYLAGDSLALITLLRSGSPLSAEFCNFVAEIIEGKIKKKRGVKAHRSIGYSLSLLHAVKEKESQLKALGLLDPKGEALDFVVKKYNLPSVERLDKIIYPRKPKNPKNKVAK
jgi:hypothetical protein